MFFKKVHPFYFLVTAFFLVYSCGTYSEADQKTFDDKIKKIVRKSKINYTKSESGLYYFIEQAGEGDFIKFTDEVTFTYHGKLANGTSFDAKFRKTPVKFNVTKLIEGWKEAMLYLKKGAKAKLIIPPYLGYADYELDAIPKNSILLFDMEIIDVN